MKKIIYLLILLAQLSTTVWAQAFVVKNIEIDGLHRFSAATVESYLPIKRGQTLKPGQTGQIVRDLYRTGFFERISLSREGNTLIIHLVERPTIGQLKISGNSVIATDKLTTVMNTLDIAEGRIYNPAVLEKIRQGLLNQYYQLGRYNARVDITVTPMPRNRVFVKIDISEGLVAKIRRITIIGNHVFSESTLIKQLEMTTSGVLTFFTQTDKYSEVRLEQSAEKLRGFYLDHGYLRVEVKSSQAEITPDRKSVYVTFVINEGPLYTISGFDVDGDLVFPREAYLNQIHIVPGETFSRQKLLDSEKNISKYLGEQGYLFSNVSIRPKINDVSYQVYVVFDVSPGKRTYIRRIKFSDNTRTNDVVLRREMTQLEAAPASTTKIEDSKHNLSMLPYIKNVDISLNPVAELDDQVDLDFKVKEDNAGQVSFKVGYSQTYGFMVGAGINQKNFLGTGNTLGLNLQRNKSEQFYGIDYTNPYYTEDGISRSLNLSFSRVNPKEIQNFPSGYAINEVNAGVLYGIPVGQEAGAYNRVSVGLSYNNILVSTNNRVSSQVSSFLQEHGRRYQEADFRIGYSRNNYDRALFPTRGSLNTFFVDVYAPLDKDSLSFYTFNYHGKLYIPLTEQFIFLTRADFAYGNGFHGPSDYPFFKNFYAGGIDSVRGYLGLNLGPRDSNGNAFGGNLLADASIALIFPNYITENLRTSVFFDAGNVYTTYNNHKYPCTITGPNAPANPVCSTNGGPIRFSFGLEADWLTPFGPVQISVAKPINPQYTSNKKQGYDERDWFQFALGANF